MSGEPDPEAYAAAPAAPAPAPPVSSSREGLPRAVSTVTFSEKATTTCSVSPAAYDPVRFGDETRTASGAAVSITMSFEPLSDSRWPGSGRNSLTGWPVPAAGAIVPPLSTRAEPPA